MATAVHVDDAGTTRGQPCAWPTLESFEDAVRNARRTVNRVQATTADFATTVRFDIRRYPLAAIGIAAATGAVVGCVVGVAAAWFAERRPE